ncbi:hypothetical protein GJ697_25925 [Pseudoduganella sp. FT25W]|uniref:Uncharacterized protein n=1 Tax=Duganella alba TaxID=2666081 RepID=A0A6L5QPL2_9BURK|nr:hypothetical protein [Duganella alba]MRX11268.1 hypothetical protein [Duganella alba]MRX19140.1 hypothetical protein [Duganella alba]
MFALFSVVFLIVFLWGKGAMKMDGKKAYRLEEPLLIEGKDQNSYSLLPQGTVLYYDKSWDEGHSTYHVYFNVKGDFRATMVQPSGIDPVWMRTVPGDELPKLLADYPVSLAELTAILKAKRATKQDLVQILRDWKD